MTIQEERLLLEKKLSTTIGLKEQAEVILEILKHYSSIYNGHEDVYVERLLKLSARLKNDVYKAWVFYYKGNILWASGNYTGATDENKKATDLFATHNNHKGLAYAYNLTGKIHFRQGNYNGALSMHFAALKLAEEAGDKFVMAKALTGVGITYMHQFKFPEALTHLMSSLHLREEIGDKRGIADSRSFIGQAYLNQNSDADALAQHFTALKIRDEIGDKEGLANSYESIGMVYRRQANYTEALANFFSCLKIREATRNADNRIEDKPGIASVYNMIGVVYTLQGNYAEALPPLQVSLKLNEEIGYKEGVARALHNIGRIYYELKDYKKALADTLAGLKILEDVNSRLGICGSNIFLGKVYIALKEYKAASTCLSIGLQIAEDIANKGLRKEALECWYELKKAENDVVSALFFHEQLREVEKELNNEENIKKIAGLQFSYQIDRQEQELLFERQKKQVLQEANELLAKEKKEAEYQQQRAERSERTKQMFLANMSHEIRTPMNAIMGMTNLLLSTQQNKRNLDYLEAIRHSSDSLLVVINDILDLSKIEAGKLTLENIPFNLKIRLKMLRQMFELKARDKHILFKIEGAAKVPANLTGDPNRLNQVLINLVGNAFKFTGKGSVTLSVKPERGSKYRFSVTDTGIGIAADKLESIFENFSQADSGTTRQYGGTGLGLTISKQLVELMGGKITVKSTPGKGSEFSFVITLKPGKSVNLPPVVDNSLLNAAKDLTGLRILLAEDNEYNQIVAVETLKKLIHKPHITVANTGKEVLEKLTKGDFNIIFMDLHMPVMDGYETTRKIRADFTGAKKNIPIVALTASVLKADLDSCIKSGMNGYVNKPFLPAELLAEIYKHARGKLSTPQLLATEKKTSTRKGQVDSSYLEKLTERKPAEILEYINIFLKFAPLQLVKIEEAIKAGNGDALYKALHTIKPQLKIMGVQNALLKTEQLETEVKYATKLNEAMKKNGLIICKNIVFAMKHWSKIKETLN